MATALDAPVTAGEAGKFYEIVNDVRREIAPMGARAGVIASLLSAILGKFVQEKALGLVLVEVLFVLQAKPKIRRQPDVAFVAFDRLPDPIFEADSDPAAFNAVPNLAVEVVSPTDRAADLAEKVRHYFQAGVQAVWLIYPTMRSVHLYDGPKSVRILTEEDELDGGAALPGFRTAVAMLFQLPTRPQ